jgi:diguanylate cyclase (GGDEF)-like protein
VLAGFASLVKDNLSSDVVSGRLGGEEFVVFSAQHSMEEFLALAECLRAALEQTDLPIDDGNVRITVSIGIAEQVPEMRAAADLLRVADGALYKAKLGGRNRVMVGE